MQKFLDLFRPKPPADTLEAEAGEVIEHQHRYWSALTLNFLINASVVFFAVGVPLGFLEATRLLMPVVNGVELPQFRFELSGQAALAAFGVLATLVVALQVSVRTPLPQEDRPAAVARQMTLETLARLCGAGAVAVGLAASVGQIPTGQSFDTMRVLGPLAGAFLLALFAGDAASASNARLGQAVSAQRAEIAKDRLVVGLETASESTTAAGGLGYVAQVVAAAAVIPLALVWLYFLQWTAGGPDAGFILVAAGCVGAAELVMAGLIVAVRNLWIHRDWVGAVYCALLVGLCISIVAYFAYMFQPPPFPSDARTVVWRLAVSAAVVVVFVVAGFAVATRILWSRQRGLGTAALMALLRFSITRIEAEKRADMSLRRQSMFVVCVIVPLVGLVWAYQSPVLRQEAASGKPRRLLLVGWISLAAWAAAVGALLIANPQA